MNEASAEPEVSGSDSGSDLDTEGEVEACPPKSKKFRKLAGAATYKTKYNPAWKKEFPFITSVSGDPYR